MPNTNDEAIRICHQCVCNQYLASEILKQGRSGVCKYCGDTRESIPLSDLSERIALALGEHFVLTPHGPETPEEYFTLAIHGNWRRRGESVEDVVADLAGLDEPAVGDVIDGLSTGFDTYRTVKEGGEHPYDSEALYETRELDTFAYHSRWEEFRREIGSRARFFNSTAEKILFSILGDLESYMAPDGKSVIREVDPTTEDYFVWRARVAHYPEDVEKILESPVKSIGPPPANSAAAGRMNAQGIPVFYGARDLSTCIAEIRAPVGSFVVAARFKFSRPVRLLDLNALEHAYADVSLFEPESFSHQSRAAFLRWLANEISRPVSPLDETSEYLSTQALAEYLANRSCSNLDGIIYRSSQAGGTGSNLVLFSHVSAVAPYEVPTGTDVKAHFYQAPQDDEDSEVYVYELVPPEDEEQSPDTETTLGAAMLRIKGKIVSFEYPDEDRYGSEAHREPTLQMDIDSITVMEITGVKYHYDEFPVMRDRLTKESAPAATDEDEEPTSESPF